MTKHYPRPTRQQQEAEQSKPKPEEKGWYCFEHGIRWICHICGANVNGRETDKYYFVNG
jgi:hypothetical protein